MRLVPVVLLWGTQALHFFYDACKFVYQIGRLRPLAWWQGEKFPNQETGAVRQSEDGSCVRVWLRCGVPQTHRVTKTKLTMRGKIFTLAEIDLKTIEKNFTDRC
jgi:hypothetical protein